MFFLKKIFDSRGETLVDDRSRRNSPSVNHKKTVNEKNKTSKHPAEKFTQKTLNEKTKNQIPNDL